MLKNLIWSAIYSYVGGEENRWINALPMKIRSTALKKTLFFSTITLLSLLWIYLVGADFHESRKHAFVHCEWKSRSTDNDYKESVYPLVVAIKKMYSQW